jgi:hypothetical protein
MVIFSKNSTENVLYHQYGAAAQVGLLSFAAQARLG